MSYKNRKPNIFRNTVIALLLLFSSSFFYGCSVPSESNLPPVVSNEPSSQPSGEYLGAEEVNHPINPEAPPDSNKTPTLSDRLIVDFIDVGQGDSILVISPDKKTMLIDAGDKGMFNVIDERLKRYGVNKIDVLIASHPHADHIGSMEEIVEAYPIGEIYMPDAIATTKVFERLLISIEKKGLNINTVEAGDKIDFSPYLQSNILSPAKETTTTNLNDASIVLHLLYGETSFLFTGDIESSAEKEISSFFSADVLKVAHHGSDSSTSNNFLSAMSPSIAIISVGRGNKYGHPDSVVLDKLNAMGVTALRTDQLGHITIESDGINIEVVSDTTIADNSTSITDTATKEPTVPKSELSSSDIKSESTEMVYVTNTGSKYHREGCRHLSESSILTTKTIAEEKGLEPCKVCSP